MVMDPEELSLLRGLGDSLLRNFAPIPLAILIYGIFSLLFCFSISLFIRRHRDTASERVIFLATALGFVISTVNIAASIADFAVLIRIHFVDYVELPTLDLQDALGDKVQFKSTIITEWTADLLPILSDIFVIWRAWNLFPERRWVIGIPIFLWIASIVTMFTFLGLISSPSRYYSTFSQDGSNRRNYYIYDASVGLSMLTNAVATSLIGYKLWSYRKFIANNMGAGTRSPVQKILFLLVESGVLYCCLQLVYLLTDCIPAATASDAGNIVNNILFVIYTGISAMYPTIILVIVRTQHSFVDMYVFTAENKREGAARSRQTTTLIFAVPPMQTSTNAELESSLATDPTRSITDDEKYSKKAASPDIETELPV